MANGSLPSTSENGQTTLAGVGWMLVAGAFMAATWMFVKLAGASLHPFVVVFWRNILGTMILLPWLLRSGALMFDKIGSHAVRATSGSIAIFATFYAIANAPIATVQAINFAAPIFATIGAAIFLGEKLRMRRVVGLVIGFAGVLIVLRPGAAVMTPGIMSAIFATAAISFSIIAVKRLVGLDSTLAVVGWSYVLMIPPSIVAVAFVWNWPSGIGWLYVAGVGVSSLCGQLAMVRAFALADATAIMPYDFLRFAIVVAMGVWIFDESIDAATLLGGAIILGSTIYLAYRETVLARHGPARTPRLD